MVHLIVLWAWIILPNLLVFEFLELLFYETRLEEIRLSEGQDSSETGFKW
jgi:hypothetical protein